MVQTTGRDLPATARFRPLRMVLIALWFVAVIVAGAVLTSQHQPIQVSPEVLPTLFGPATPGYWRVIHVLSGSCGCSQRIMAHLARRHRLPDFAEEVVLIDDGTPYLPETNPLLHRLEADQFHVRHLRPEDLPRGTSLYGVPLLLVASPSGQMRYAGGYGPSGSDEELLSNLRSGQRRAPFPVLGCVVGRALQRKADPFQLKYSRTADTSGAPAKSQQQEGGR